MSASNKSGLHRIGVLETAKRLDVARSTLYGFINPRSKYFKADFPKLVRIGSSVGFLEQDIDEYLIAQRAGPKDIDL